MADPSSPTGTAIPQVGAASATPTVRTPIESTAIVVVDNAQDDVEIDADRWSALARAVLVDEHANGELTLTFVDRAEMTALNAEHMGADGPTDVLSFPLDEADAPPVANVPVLLGDVVICPAVAAEAAPAHAGTLDDELALLTVHGVLHVLGHDHAEPDETQRMRAAEIDHLTRHHWRGPAPSGFLQEQM